MVQTIHMVLFLVILALIIICTVLQRRALNKMAFGRSMFISWTSIIMGLMVGMRPNVATTIIAVVLLVIGIGFMLLMGLKSYQRLKRTKYQTQTAGH